MEEMEEKTALLQSEMEETHQRTFLRWINSHLKNRPHCHQLNSITDFDDGITLIRVYFLAFYAFLVY